MKIILKLNKTPKIQTKNFAGIGTRKISSLGEDAIKNVFLTSIHG